MSHRRAIYLLDSGEFWDPFNRRLSHGAQRIPFSSRDITRRWIPSRGLSFSSSLGAGRQFQELALSRVAQGGFSYRSVALNAIITAVLLGAGAPRTPVPTLRASKTALFSFSLVVVEEVQSVRSSRFARRRDSPSKYRRTSSSCRAIFTILLSAPSAQNVRLFISMKNTPCFVPSLRRSPGVVSSGVQLALKYVPTFQLRIIKSERSKVR